MNYLKYTQSFGDGQMVGDALTYALLFFDQGVKIAPCYPKSKAFCEGFGPHKSSVSTETDLNEWILEKGYNYAILTGTGKKHLVVIDFDDLAIYEQWAAEAGKDLAETFKVKSCRGMHVYYWSKDARSWRGDGFEVMGLGKAIMGPGSIHPNNVVYIPETQPYVREIDTLSDFPLLSESRPELPPPPQNAPESIGGGLVGSIKRTWRIFDVISDRGDLAGRVKLKTSDRGAGRWFVGFCPFHDDRRKRSFWIDTSRNTYGCRSCGAKGDVINFVATIEGLTVREAINRMKGGV